MKVVKHLKIKPNMQVKEIVENMQNMGFGAGKIFQASEIMKKMFDDKDCKVFLGVAGAMVPAGMKNIILDLLDDSDVFVTTGANLTHDLIESLGNQHYLADSSVENIDDSKLNKQGFDRIYNVFMKNEVYEKLEDFFEKSTIHVRRSKAATAAFTAFSSPVLKLSFVIFPSPPLLTTPVIHPPLSPIEAVSVKTVDDSIS